MKFRRFLSIRGMPHWVSSFRRCSASKSTHFIHVCERGRIIHKKMFGAAIVLEFPCHCSFTAIICFAFAIHSFSIHSLPLTLQLSPLQGLWNQLGNSENFSIYQMFSGNPCLFALTLCLEPSASILILVRKLICYRDLRVMDAHNSRAHHKFQP